MAYSHIPTDHIADRDLKRVADHASMLLADVYTMLGTNPSTGANGGRCNFSIGLVLSCIIDGLATEIWPIQPTDGENQFDRMKLLMDRMPWGRKADGWITRVEAAKVVYHEIRNPLVHNLGANTRWRGRRTGFSDAAIVIQTRERDFSSPDQLEHISSWPAKSPAIWVQKKNSHGPARFVVSAPAFYWHVKRLTNDLLADERIIAQAVKLRRTRRVK